MFLGRLKVAEQVVYVSSFIFMISLLFYVCFDCTGSKLSDVSIQ